MADIPNGLWLMIGALGFFAALAFLRVLSTGLQKQIDTHNIAREAVRLRRNYEADIKSRMGDVDDDGVIEL